MEMTDAAWWLRTSYESLLTGQLTAQGKIVPVSSFKSPTTKDVVVVLGNIAETENGGNKDRFGKEVTFNLEVQHYIIGTGALTSSLVDNVGAQIQKLLRPGVTSGSPINASPDWRVVSTQLLTSGHLTANTATGQLVRKIMVFQHTLKQIG